MENMIYLITIEADKNFVIVSTKEEKDEILKEEAYNVYSVEHVSEEQLLDELDAIEIHNPNVFKALMSAYSDYKHFEVVKKEDELEEELFHLEMANELTHDEQLKTALIRYDNQLKVAGNPNMQIKQSEELYYLVLSEKHRVVEPNCGWGEVKLTVGIHGLKESEYQIIVYETYEECEEAYQRHQECFDELEAMEELNEEIEFELKRLG